MEKGRPNHEFYHIFYDANKRYYSATRDSFGNPVITDNQFPVLLKNPPTNFKDLKISIGTNKFYQSGVRAVALQFNFVEDAADILREFYYNRGGYAAELYYIVVRWDYKLGYYRKYLETRFDFKTKKDNAITGFSISCVDTSIWGVLSQNDTVPVQIDCTSQNTNTIPVLMDGITLQARYTFQPIGAIYDLITSDAHTNYTYFIIPLILVNTDGDSSGIIVQSEDFFNTLTTDLSTFLINNPTYFFVKSTKIIQAHIVGDYTFTFKITGSPVHSIVPINFSIFSNSGGVIPIKTLLIPGDINNAKYTVHIDSIIDFVEGESLSFVLNGDIPGSTEDHFSILPDINNIFVTLKSKADASIARSLRPLDLLQSIVQKLTLGKFTANSNFFAENNNVVCTSGDAIRLDPNAYIKTTFQDWWKSYDSLYWLAFRIINDQLWVEPFTVIYDKTNQLFDLGEISDPEITDATEYLFNQINVGSPKQDYRHSSGRLEFNGNNKFAVYQYNIKQTLDILSAYRKDGYGAEFIRLDYQQQSTIDNTGDDSVFMLDITDEKGSQGVSVENFVTVNVNNAPLSPIIYTPFSNDTIPNNKPTIKGVCQPLTNVFIYCDNVLDGSTTSDANGNWSYDIQTALTPFVDGVTDGIHTIDATFTDETGTVSSVTVFITTDTIPVSFDMDDTYYDNKPLIKGFAPAGTVINLSYDGITLGNTTTDGSCRWQFKPTTILNGVHTLNANGVTKTITFNPLVSTPLITSFADGNQIVNNLPLVEGVAIPGTYVTLWSNYYPDVPLGGAYADIWGNWKIQLVPIFKTDGITPLAPLPNGLNVLSTSLTIQSATISESGYLLNRPDYSSIEGVIDNTVFNTRLTPKLSIIARMVFFKSVFAQQPNTIITFAKGDKNEAFATTLDGVTVRERDNIQLNQYTDKAFFLPMILNAKVTTPFFFVDVMNNFSSGGQIKAEYQGNELFCLPIGEMTVQDITNDVQEWKLLISADTPLSTLLKLSTPGLIINTMNSAIWRSDYNMLHIVPYDFQKQTKFTDYTIYDTLFEERNTAWQTNPKQVQKIQKSDGEIVDQIITNGVGGPITLKFFKLGTSKFYNSYTYTVVDPSPIPFPDVVQQLIIDWNDFEEGVYFAILYVDITPVGISESIHVAEEHSGTVFISSTNSKNKPGGLFSTGFSFAYRINGMLKKPVVSAELVQNEDDSGDFQNNHSIVTTKRPLVLGNGEGIPDYQYIKVIAGLTLDTLQVENQDFVLSKGANLEPQKEQEGHPMYYYFIDLEQKTSQQGGLIPVSAPDFTNSVVVVMDAGAFGLPGGLINVEEKPE